MILFHWKRFASAWGKAPENLSVTTASAYVREGVSSENFTNELKTFVEAADLDIQETATLRNSAMGIFDRTFTITRIMRLLALLIACAALTTSLSAVHLSRLKSLAVQRTLGFSLQRLVGSLLMQCFLIGLTSFALIVPAGWGVSWMLINVLNRASFGWKIELDLMNTNYQTLFVWVVASSVLAGLIPIWRSFRVLASAVLKGEG